MGADVWAKYEETLRLGTLGVQSGLAGLHPDPTSHRHAAISV